MTRSSVPGRVPAIPLAGLALAAVATGLLAGVGELAIVFVHTRVLGRIARVSPHAVWMCPATNVAIFLAAALGLHALGRLWRPAATFRATALLLVSLLAFTLLLYVPGLWTPIAAFLAVGIGWEASRRLNRREAQVRRLLARAVGGAGTGVAVISAAALGGGSSGAPEPVGQAPAEAPNVLLVILDTVRAKSVSALGYARPTTPRLERLARRGVLFERAYATSPWTLPTHGSLFTGRYPHELRASFFVPLDDTYPTLAEVLGARGWATAGFTANVVYTSRTHGLDRGFDRYEDYPLSVGQAVLSTSIGREVATSTTLRNALGWHELLNRKSAARVNRDFLRWLDSEPGGRPFFAFLNYFDAHEPYLPPEPFRSRLGGEERRGPLRHWGGLAAGAEAKRPAEWKTSAEIVRHDLDAYEAAVAYVDHELGRLVDELERRGELERTVIVIASDHGEHHGERGLHHHANSLYVPLLHVPLLVLFPGRVPEGARVEAPVTLRDVPATVMELAGLEGGPFPGRSLSRHWNPDVTVPPEPVLSEWEDGPTFSLIRGRWHYLMSVDLREELYDLARDPDEERNLAGDPEALPALREMRQEMLSALQGFGPGPGTAAP